MNTEITLKNLMTIRSNKNFSNSEELQNLFSGICREYLENYYEDFAKKSLLKKAAIQTRYFFEHPEDNRAIKKTYNKIKNSKGVKIANKFMENALSKLSMDPNYNGIANFATPRIDPYTGKPLGVPTRDPKDNKPGIRVEKHNSGNTANKKSIMPTNAQKTNQLRARAQQQRKVAF